MIRFWSLFLCAWVQFLRAESLVPHSRHPRNERIGPESSLYDAKQGIKMGVPNGGCDDAQTGLDMDWDGSPTEYVCYYPTKPLIPNPKIESKLECENLASNYLPRHFCMNEKLTYNTSIPTHGDHRPLWPKFGEYRYVPPQRWLHNIEHGSVVMLYHPCTHHRVVDKLRQIVKGCLRKHIITPSAALTRKRPLALVAWGCRLTMSEVNEKEVVKFIREKGLKGPEGSLPKQGQYEFHLLEQAAVVPGSDERDSQLCPKFS